jgi:hypothetical protein
VTTRQKKPAGKPRPSSTRRGSKIDREIDQELQIGAEPSSSGLIGQKENARLDDLNRYIGAILSRLSGDELDLALAGEVARRGRGDAAFRDQAIQHTHPDDLVATLVRNGYHLAKVGLSSVS